MNEYYVDEINKTVNFIFKFNDNIKSEIKNCDLNSRWNDELKQWVVPINKYSKQSIFRIIKKHGFNKRIVTTKDVEFSYEKGDVDYAYLKGLCDSKDFSYTPRKYQLECLGYGIDKGSYILGDDVGLGKCEYVENRVFTPNGRKRIGDIKEGEFVIGLNGLRNKVLKVHKQPKNKELYRVTFNDGFSALFTKEHLFTVSSNVSGFNNNKRNLKTHTLSISQMLDKDFEFVTNGSKNNKNKKYVQKSYYKQSNGSNKWQIPIVKPIVFENNYDLPIDPYLLGFIIGDGHISKSGKAYLEFHKDDFDEVLNGVKYKEIVSKNNCRKASLLGLNEKLKNLGLNGKLSYFKFIPEMYKYSSIEDRLSILQGLMDSDGTFGKNGIASFSTSSKKLLEGLVEIAHSLGGICRLSKPKYKKYTHNGKKKISKNLSYSCSIKLPKRFSPFRLKRKLNLYKYPTKYPVGRYIKDISFEKYGDSVCISVENEDCLYVTEHGIVTHNTFESIMYAETSNKFPCLVVVPSSVKYNWKEKWLEITKGNRTVSVIESSSKNDWSSDVIVINYDIIGKKQGTGTTLRFQELDNIDWNMIIFDEAHFLKEKKSQRSQAAKKICDKKKGVIVQLLTGTAIMSKPIEIWNLLTLIKKDKSIASSWHQFITRYCGGYGGKFGWVTDGATNILELNKKLRENCYIRREKRDVLTELPDVIKQVIQVPITNQRKIDKATKDFIEYIKQNKGQEAAEKAMEAEHLVAIGELRKLSIQGKLKAIDQYIKDWKVASNKKMIIFAIHKEPLENLSSKYKCPLISGGVSAKKKQEIVNDWISSEDQFLFANMESAGTGVDGLQNICSNMIIIELPWRPSDLTQVIGRLDRSGQGNTTNVNYLLSDCTIDREMWEMLENKERVTEAVNKGIDIRRNGSGMKAVIKKILKRK